MTIRKLAGAVIVCAGLLPYAPDVRSTPDDAQPASDHLVSSVIGAGGQPCSHAGLRLNTTSGQVAIGVSGQGNRLFHAGFWARRPGVTVGLEPTVQSIWRNALHGNHPNPFNPTTTIAFEVGAEDRVLLEVFDLSGRRLRVLLDEVRPPGPHAVVWNGRDGLGRSTASGLYLCRLSIGSQEFTNKLLLLK